MLQHVGWRWYQPDFGRFVQRGPARLRGGLNLYAYCANSPLISVDPSGLDWVSTGPWWAQGLANFTGGTEGSSGWSDFWDNRSTINADNVGAGAGIVGAGIAIPIICLSLGPSAPAREYIGGYLFRNGQLVGKVVINHGGVVGENFVIVSVRVGQGIMKIISVPAGLFR